MSSKQFVSALVLVILTALPVSGSVCAMLCDAAKNAATAGHHAPAKHCEEPAPSSTGVQIRGVSEHDCSVHDAPLRQASLTAADKASASGTPIPPAASLVAERFTSQPDARSYFQHSSPPGTAPPTTTPLVLRI